MCNMLHSTTTSPHTHLLSLPYDVRRLIYEYFFPVNKHIHLTSGPISKEAIPEGSTESRLPPGATSLMRVCKQVNLETTPILYATNTFFMVADETLQSQSHWISLRWLHNPRVPTRQMVRKLEILVEVPMERSLMIGLLSGVAHFPHLEIKVKDTRKRIVEKDCNVRANLYKERSLEKRNQTTALCKGVMRSRGAHQTVWNDGGSFSSVFVYYQTGIIRDTTELSGRVRLVRLGAEDEYRWIVDGDEWTRRDADFRSSPPWKRIFDAPKLR